jgi:hypothetical protein
LKKIKLHTVFHPDSENPLREHPAMKEIQAISKLVHKNIVRYQGCWVEADEPDENQLNRMVQKINKTNKNPLYVEEISENEEDDPEFVMNV